MGKGIEGNEDDREGKLKRSQEWRGGREHEYEDLSG